MTRAVPLEKSWIQSAGWDLVWMFSALWGASLLCLELLVTGQSVVAALALVLTPAISIGHAWSTTYMVLGSPLLAAERRAHPRKYRVIPALIVVGCVTLGVVVATSQRFPADGRLGGELWPWMLYIGLLWVGHFWHFGNQDFGVLTLYRTRAGQTGYWDRRVDKLYTATLMYVVQPIVHVYFVRTTAFGEMVATLLPIARETLAALVVASLALACAFYLGVVAFELSKRKRSLPKLLYDTVIVSHPLLLAGSVHTGSYPLAHAYVLAYLWSHWLIAIGLVARINVRYQRSRGATPGLAIAHHAAVLGLIAGAGWMLFQHHGRYNLFNTDGFAYKEVLASITPDAELLVGLLFGFFLTEQILHYYCDRCLFRYRDPGVRRAVLPLLL